MSRTPNSILHFYGLKLITVPKSYTRLSQSNISLAFKCRVQLSSFSAAFSCSSTHPSESSFSSLNQPKTKKTERFIVVWVFSEAICPQGGKDKTTQPISPNCNVMLFYMRLNSSKLELQYLFLHPHLNNCVPSLGSSLILTEIGGEPAREVHFSQKKLFAFLWQDPCWVNSLNSAAALEIQLRLNHLGPAFPSCRI